VRAEDSTLPGGRRRLRTRRRGVGGSCRGHSNLALHRRVVAPDGDPQRGAACVGKTADESKLADLRRAAQDFHPGMACDIVRAYHFGPRFLVELEMVMDASTPLKTSHDVGMELQREVEARDDVERCFVHVSGPCRRSSTWALAD